MDFDGACITSMAVGQGLFNVITCYTGEALTYAALIDCGSEGGLNPKYRKKSIGEQRERLRGVMKSRAETFKKERGKNAEIDLYLDLVLISHFDSDHYNWIPYMMDGLVYPLKRSYGSGFYLELLKYKDRNQGNLPEEQEPILQEFRLYFDAQEFNFEASYEETADIQIKGSNSWTYCLFKRFLPDTSYRYLCGVEARLHLENAAERELPQEDSMENGFSLKISAASTGAHFRHNFEFFTTCVILAYEKLQGDLCLIRIEILNLYESNLRPSPLCTARIFVTPEGEGEELEFEEELDVDLSGEYITDMLMSMEELTEYVRVDIPLICNRIDEIASIILNETHHVEYETMASISSLFFDESGNRVTNEGSNAVIEYFLAGGSKFKTMRGKDKIARDQLLYLSSFIVNEFIDGGRFGIHVENMAIEFMGLNQKVSAYYCKADKKNLKELEIGSLKSEENANSVLAVFSLFFGENCYKALFTGDATGHTMYYLLQDEELAPLIAGASLLMAPHHGSITTVNYASSEILECFLENVYPDYVMISAGYNSQFGHPQHTFVRSVYKYFDNLGKMAEPHCLFINMNDSGMQRTSRMRLVSANVPIFANASFSPPEYRNYTFQIGPSGCLLRKSETAFQDNSITGNYSPIPLKGSLVLNPREERLSDRSSVSCFCWDKRPVRSTERQGGR